MKTAKAAVFMGKDLPFKITEYPLTAPAEGMAKMKLIASGVCGTDIHIHRGKLNVGAPAIIGHEFVGRVEEISQKDSEKYGINQGDAVIVDIACPCGECLLCKEGDDANCLNMGVTNGYNPETQPHFYGGFGEYNYSPVKNLIKIPAGINPKMACVFACAGPTALHAFNLAKRANCQIENAKVAVVQGLGPVGMFALMYLAFLKIEHIFAIDAGKTPEKEALALSFGATKVCNLNTTSPEEINDLILAASGGKGADIVFEASGNPKAVPQGMQLLRNRGIYLVPGQYSNSGGVEIHPQLITFKALRIIGSSQYSISDVQDYITFLENNPHLHDKILKLATCYSVEDINQAFDDAKAGKNIKTMLAPKD